MQHTTSIRFLAIFLTLATAASTPFGSACRATPAEGASDRPAIQQLESLLTRTDGKPSVDELMSFERSNAGSRPAALSRFLRGQMAFDAKDWGTAAAVLDASEIHAKTSLGDYAALYRGRALVQMQRPADAFAVFSAGAEKYPASLVARDCRLEAAQAASASADFASVLTVLDPLIAADDGDALALAGDASAASGKQSQAVSYYRRAYFFGAAAPGAQSAQAKLKAAGVDPDFSSPTEQELRTRAEKLYAAELWKDAATAYGRLIAALPSARDREALLLKQGTAASNARDAATAVAALQLISNADKERHAEALYQMAIAYRRGVQLADFEATGARLRATYPQSEWTGKFLGEYVEYLESKKRDGEMYPVQRALIEGFPTSEKAAKASYDNAWLAYKTHDFRRAADLFFEHLATFRTPTSKWIGEAAFWGGKAYENIGNPSRALFFYDLARQRYPYGYHGLVATRRADDLKRRYPKTKAEEPAPKSPLAAVRDNALAVQPIEETADDRFDPRRDHANDFQTIWLWDQAMRELSAALAEFPTSPKVSLRFAKLFRDRGDNYQATLILRKGYPDVYSYRDDQMPREAWEIMFPLTHWEAIKRNCDTYNLDPYIIAGLIRQESVFNPKATSRSNARGLMQLIPSTGRLVAKTQGLGAISPGDLYNPSLNITLGTSYFAQMLQKFGRVEFACAAYNAGPGRVNQWQAARSVDPIEEWVENIPISETRGYVMGVLRYSANYRRLYGSEINGGK